MYQAERYQAQLNALTGKALNESQNKFRGIGKIGLDIYTSKIILCLES